MSQFWVFVLYQFEFLSFVKLLVFKACCYFNSSFVTIWVEFYHNLIWVLTLFDFFYSYIAIWVLSKFEILSFATIWVFAFSYNLNFLILLVFKFRSHLSIWFEMEFTRDIFLKTSVSADYSQTILKNNKINIYITKSLKRFFLKTFLKFCGLWNFV